MRVSTRKGTDGDPRRSRARRPARQQVAKQLMAHNAVAAHARDELGISSALSARPIQAALASAGSFAGGAVMPRGPSQ